MEDLKNRQLVAVVRFLDESDAETVKYPSKMKDYEYLLPLGSVGTEEYAVVSPQVPLTRNSMKVVKIREIRQLADQRHEGDLKPVVAAFSTRGFLEWTERLAKKKALMAQIEKKVAERSKVAQLEALAGDDPEARALLDALRAL